jgi:hypothetical protein
MLTPEEAAKAIDAAKELIETLGTTAAEDFDTYYAAQRWLKDTFVTTPR